MKPQRNYSVRLAREERKRLIKKIIDFKTNKKKATLICNIL